VRIVPRPPTRPGSGIRPCPRSIDRSCRLRGLPRVHDPLRPVEVHHGGKRGPSKNGGDCSDECERGERTSHGMAPFRRRRRKASSVASGERRAGLPPVAWNSTNASRAGCARHPYKTVEQHRRDACSSPAAHNGAGPVAPSCGLEPSGWTVAGPLTRNGRSCDRSVIGVRSCIPTPLRRPRTADRSRCEAGEGAIRRIP
jgi:hypothetical protein